MIVFGRFQDCFSPLVANTSAGFLVYQVVALCCFEFGTSCTALFLCRADSPAVLLFSQHHFDFNRSKNAGDGVVRSTTFMHHDYNKSTMPREIDESEDRVEPLRPQVRHASMFLGGQPFGYRLDWVLTFRDNTCC